MVKLLFRIVIVIAAYGAFLVLTLPAAQVFRYFQKTLPMVKMSGLKGTVWNARIENLQMGKALFRSGSISLHALSLLGTNKKMTVSLSGYDTRIKGVVVIGPKQAVSFENLEAKLDANNLHPQFRIPLRASGKINVDLKKLAIQHSRIVGGEGKITWNYAVVHGPVDIKLGTLTCDLSSKNKTTVGNCKNKNGEIGLTGSFTMNSHGGYSSNFILKAKQEKHKQLFQQMQRYGRYHSNGSLVVQHNGVLR